MSGQRDKLSRNRTRDTSKPTLLRQLKTVVYKSLLEQALDSNSLTRIVF